jgi:hypothetical protein
MYVRQDGLELELPLLIFLSHPPGAGITGMTTMLGLLIFCVLRWEVYLKYFCCISKHDDFLRKAVF